MARAAAMASTPEPQPRSSTRRNLPRTGKLVDGEQAAERRAVMGGAEGFAGIDENGARPVRDAAAVVAAVHDEAPGDHRRQGGLRDRHPIEVRQVFKLDVGDRAPLSARSALAAASASARLCV